MPARRLTDAERREWHDLVVREALRQPMTTRQKRRLAALARRRYAPPTPAERRAARKFNARLSRLSRKLDKLTKEPPRE